jgi:hypothetical protein
MLRPFAAGLLLVASLLLQLGCAGGRGDVRFDSLRYPVSMSGYVYDQKNRALSPKSLDVVAEFEHEARLWGMFFSWIPVNGDLDLSEPINRDVDAAGGEGVINLSVKSEGCAFNYIPGLSLLPFWPGCADVTVAGQVVKRKRVRR